MKRSEITVLAVALLFLAVVSLTYAILAWRTAPPGALHPIASVDYLCGGGKTIKAAYYAGPSAPAPLPGEPPVPTGNVALSLSDGRSMVLPQTISASGIRYANTDSSIVFWSKGNGAFITEGSAQTFAGCIALVLDPGGLPQIYASSTAGFSIRYPAGYVVDGSYAYQELGPGKDIAGVKFLVPKVLASGTNLSSYDTGVSVEEIPRVQACDASLFLYDSVRSASVVDNGTDYSVATSSGVGAGNFYQETVWAVPGTDPCMAVRYFVHSTNIYNYPPDTVREFDHAALLAQFDAIRRSLTVAP